MKEEGAQVQNKLKKKWGFFFFNGSRGWRGGEAPDGHAAAVLTEC